ncbi:relaxase/mobilization nuclease domain-containing protein [Bacteroides acidifaciens]|uniref:relaxase/mobilization nuclease domain-containing protein n=1 Tax=Bacteroides acidifaciens TaxID=85831 RepID=UPI0025A66168|nr:relaxase/mobilization nuclease domain-containing protein [Bacteroides acidifaciens]
MMGKISKGGSFGGCVDYVTRKKKDNPDGTPCKEWRLIDHKDVSTMEGRDGIIASFEDNLALNPDLKNPVGHISLNFHANDKDKVDDKTMVEIAQKYMKKMGIVDTPYIIVRHLDKDYPHCHIVFSRIDNHAETISDKNDFSRNRAACLDLTKEYGLHISEGKRQTNVNKLRGTEKIRYEIFNAVEAVWNDKSVHTFEQFEARLKTAGVGIEYKYKRGSNELQGLWYTRKGKRFAASKIDRRFSLGNISKHFANNKPLHPQSRWMYADGSIVPIASYKGVRFSTQQINDYVAGKTVRVDGCSGGLSTVFIKFDSQRMSPVVYSSNPDSVKQSASQSQNIGMRSTYVAAGGPPSQDEGFVHGSASPDAFKLWLSRHPGLTIDEAISRYREEQKAKRRRQRPKLH